MATAHERVLARVHKMLKLANDAGATEGERDNALRMAHATLAKYNLDLSDVESIGQRKTSAATEERVENVVTFYGRPWARHICKSVADLFYCYYLTTSAKKATDTRHYFIGKKSNATTASIMAEFLVNAIMKEGKKRQRQEGQGNAWFREFCWGAATRIRERVREIQQSTEKEVEKTQPGTALMLVDFAKSESQANIVFVQTKYPALGRAKAGKGYHQSGAYAAGRTYGSRVSLNRQIGS